MRRLLPTAFALALSALGACAHAQDRWEARPPMPNSQFAHGAAAVGGRFHVLGGMNTGFLTHSHYGYDPAVNAWLSLAAMPTWRSNFGTAVLGNRIHAVGGRVRELNFREVDVHEVYDPDTDTWTRRAPLPHPRWGAAAVGVGRTVFVLGGQPFSEIATVEAYDAVRDTWSQRAPMPEARSGHAAVELGGVIYVTGGRLGGHARASVYAYDIRADLWSVRAPMQTARSGHVAVVLDGQIHVIGGSRGSGSTLEILSSAEIYDPGRDSWATSRPMGRGRVEAAGAVLRGIVHVAGGLTLFPTAPGLPWVPTGQASHEAFLKQVRLPQAAGDCKDGGWRDYPLFANQGDCVSFVGSGGRNAPAS